MGFYNFILFILPYNLEFFLTNNHLFDEILWQFQLGAAVGKNSKIKYHFENIFSLRLVFFEIKQE
jgi:hypothetical protein